MLELTYYNTEKIDDLKDFFTVAFVLTNDIYNGIMLKSIKNRRNISECKLSDSEIITISIALKVLAHNLSFILSIITGNTINMAQIKQLIF
jgi:ribosomal protein S25